MKRKLRGDAIPNDNRFSYLTLRSQVLSVILVTELVVRSGGERRKLYHSVERDRWYKGPQSEYKSGKRMSLDTIGRERCDMGNMERWYYSGIKKLLQLWGWSPEPQTWLLS